MCSIQNDESFIRLSEVSINESLKFNTLVGLLQFQICSMHHLIIYKHAIVINQQMHDKDEQFKHQSEKVSRVAVNCVYVIEIHAQML